MIETIVTSNIIIYRLIDFVKLILPEPIGLNKIETSFHLIRQCSNKPNANSNQTHFLRCQFSYLVSYFVCAGMIPSPDLFCCFHEIFNYTQNFWALSIVQKIKLETSSLNVTKSAGNCGFGHINWRNP